MYRTWTYRIIVAFLVIAWSGGQLAAQNSFKQQVQVSTEPQFLADALVNLSQQSGINIFFSNDLVDQIVVDLDQRESTFEGALSEMLLGLNIYYKKINGHIVLYKAIRNTNKYSISGYVEDGETGERLEFATIHDFITARGSETNAYGFYSMTLPEGDLDLTFRYIGYEPEIVRVKLQRDTQIHVSLTPSNQIAEIIIRADSIDRTLAEQGLGEDRVYFDDLKRMPGLGGELDLYRYMEFLPGVNTGTDGIGGIHVRGGSNDQNLILMDGVPIYNPAHLIGIFSVFNPQAIKHASIYKANFPARYAGRLSSVMDVTTKEGNTKHLSAGLKVGLASVSGHVEGPLSKNSSFLITGRWFVPSLFFRDISSKYKETLDYRGDTYLNFYDINAKWNLKLTPRDRIYLSYYRGKDVFEDNTINRTNLKEQIQIGGEELDVNLSARQQFEKNINWGNEIAILRWNHEFNDQLFVNSSVFYSKYILQSFERNSFSFLYGPPLDEIRSGFDNQEFTTSIEDIGVRVQADFMPSLSHLIKFGGQLTVHRFLPKSITYNEESKIDDFYIEEGLLENTLFSQFEIEAIEWGLYAEDEWKLIPDRLKVNLGVHLSGFDVNGKSYWNPQLRGLIQYTPSTKFSIQAGFSEMTQYLHLLTNSGIGLPTDLWVPTTENVAPQTSVQYSAGLKYRPNKKFQFGAEVYRKKMKNLIAFQEGASFLIPEGPLSTTILDAGNWENKISVGEGLSYGIETEMEMNLSRFYGQLGYSYSRADRVFEDINFGQSFPYRYNREHAIMAQITFQASRRLLLKANWVYGSGNNITLAESKFPHPGDIFPEVGITFGSRNGYELPAYHRLDLGLQLDLGKLGNKWQHQLFVDVYNVYNRENPFYISLVEDRVEGTFSFKQFSIFRILPSIGYGINFNSKTKSKQ